MKNIADFKKRAPEVENTNTTIPSDVTQSLSTYEQAENNVKSDLDQYAKMIKETDLKVDRLREEIIEQINQATDRFNAISENKSVPQEKLNQLSQKIVQLNSTLDQLKHGDVSTERVRSEIDRLRHELETINSQKNVVAEDLESLVYQETALTSPNSVIGDPNINSVKHQLGKIHRSRQALEKKLGGFVKKINGIEEQLQKCFSKLRQQQNSVEEAWNKHVKKRVYGNDELNQTFGSPNYVNSENTNVAMVNEPTLNLGSVDFPRQQSFFSDHNDGNVSPYDQEFSKNQPDQPPVQNINLPTSFFSDWNHDFSQTPDTFSANKDSHQNAEEESVTNQILSPSGRFNFDENASVPVSIFDLSPPKNSTDSEKNTKLIRKNHKPDDQLNDKRVNIFFDQNQTNNERKIESMANNAHASRNLDLAKQPNLDSRVAQPVGPRQNTKQIDFIDFSQENLSNNRPDFLKGYPSQGRQFFSEWPVLQKTLPFRRENFPKSNATLSIKSTLPNSFSSSGTIDNLLTQLRQAQSIIPEGNERDFATGKNSFLTPSAGHFEFLMALEERLNICRDFLQSSEINSDIVNRFVKELSDISVYFQDLIARLQKNFSGIVLFKNDVLRLLPDKQKICDRFLKFQDTYQSVEARKQYNIFAAFYDEFKRRFSAVRTKIFSDQELFNAFTNDLKEVFGWIRKNISPEDLMFWVDANEILEFWTNLRSQYDRSNSNINSIDTMLSKILAKIENRLDSLDADLENISNQVALISNDSDSFANVWDESFARIDELIDSIDSISNGVSECIQELNTIFEEAVNNMNNESNTMVISQINRALEYFYGYKSVFINQIKDFDFQLSGVRHSYEQFLNRKQNISEREKELNAAINNIVSNHYVLSEWVKQCHLTLDNNLNLLKIFSQKIALSQQRVFATYNAFLNKYAPVRDHVVAVREKQRWQRTTNLERDQEPEHESTQNFSECKMESMGQTKEIENILVDKADFDKSSNDLMKKTTSLLDKLSEYKPATTEYIRTREIDE